MIKTIQIKKFGVFQNFAWPPGLPAFKQFNLIYGWNYSGKTTLSRVFRCFEQKRPHSDFTDAEAQLIDEDNAVYHLSSPHTAPELRVFNSDFVHENLSFDNGSATPILVLGAEDVAKQETLQLKKTHRITLAGNKESNERDRAAIKSVIETALTTYARDYIKNPLGIPNYDRTRFEPKVKECSSDPGSHLLDEPHLGECLSVYRSTEKKPTLPYKVVALSSVADLMAQTGSLLARVVTARTPISRLQENPVVERWVNEGRKLHGQEDMCQFCGQALPVDLLAHLAGHFSADYDNLMAEVHALAVKIQAAQEEGILLENKGEFYPELSERFITHKSDIDDLLNERRSALKTLAEALVAKQAKAFTSLECPRVDDPAVKITATIAAINTVIREHNERTAEFEKKRQEALAKLENHYAASFVRDQNYNDKLHQIADFETAIAAQNKEFSNLDSEIRTLELALSEASRGAERINELLAAYFANNDLRIAVSNDKRFQITRGGIAAKNLSEGEKTAIAFAYFITRVQDGHHPLVDTTVVIDDPISSLDAAHLFNTYALIKTQLASCRQLFISTHSFEFYNLIRDWVADDEKKKMKKPQSDWKAWGVYLIRRTDEATSVLVEIPKELLRFKSEYHYLFSMLYHFDKNETGTDDFDCLLSLPNVTRRFLEAFGGIMIPLYMGLHSKMERLFPGEIERERVWKYVNHYSHNETILRSLTIPDASESSAVVRACLKAVHDWNSDYFKDLETEIAEDGAEHKTASGQ